MFTAALNTLHCSTKQKNKIPVRPFVIWTAQVFASNHLLPRGVLFWYKIT